MPDDSEEILEQFWHGQGRSLLSTFYHNKRRHGPLLPTFGREDTATEVCVVMVRTVRIPSEILAGTASTESQKETQDSMTIIRLGM